MDISFHYFAVKSVARAAGLNEEQAQHVAEFSQFIDDYNWFAYFRASNIPGYIESPELDIVFNSFTKTINPVTTGFLDNTDMLTLILPRPQKYTVSPFHFIPQDAASVAFGDYRTVPATINDGSYVANMLTNLKNDIRDCNAPENDLLMRMGMLFHTFADTYAHQLFTGYNNKTNSATLENITDNISGEDVTTEYRFWVEKWIEKIEAIIGVKMPTIGHMAIGHIPDLTHISFTMKYTGIEGDPHYHTRSNTATFISVCQQLYEFIGSCYGTALTPNMTWEALSSKLAEGFLINATRELEESETAAIQKLTPHWLNIFNEYKYSYNGEDIKKRFMLHTATQDAPIEEDVPLEGISAKPYSDDFYKYSLFADKHLICLYGNHPRNWISKSVVEDEQFADMEEVVPYDNIKYFCELRQKVEDSNK